MKDMIIIGLVVTVIIASAVYLLLIFVNTIWIILRDRFWPEEKHTELTDAQIATLKKEFTWVNGVVAVYPVASYGEYTVFKCKQGYADHVMFQNDILVDIMTSEDGVLVDNERGILFKLDNDKHYAGHFYERRT